MSQSLERILLAAAWLGKVLKVFLTLALIFLCVTVGLAFLQVRKTAIATEQTLAHVNAVTDTVNRQAEAVGSEAHRTLLEAALTAKQARMASEDQRKYWEGEVPKLSAKAESILDNSDKLIVSLRNTSDGLNKDGEKVSNQAVDTLAAAKPALEQAASALKETAGTASAATAFISDPNFKSTVTHLNDGAANLATATKALAGTAQDIQGEVHQLTHPTPLGKIKAIGLFCLSLAEKYFEIGYYARH